MCANTYARLQPELYDNPPPPRLCAQFHRTKNVLRGARRGGGGVEVKQRYKTVYTGADELTKTKSGGGLVAVEGVFTQVTTK